MSSINRDHPAYDLKYYDFLIRRMHQEVLQNRSQVERLLAGGSTSLSARDTFKLLEPILEKVDPLDAMHQVHREAFSLAYRDLTRLDNQNLFAMTLLSTLLSIFPLRANHWPGMVIVDHDEKIADQDSFLKIERLPSGAVQYSIGVLISALKNGSKSKKFRRASSPHTIDVLPESISTVITDYLEIIRPNILQRRKSRSSPPTPHLFLSRQGQPTNYDTISPMLMDWQREWLCGSRGEMLAVSPPGFHAYRHLVATSIVKTTGNFAAAAERLLDSEPVVRDTYARFIPDDALRLTGPLVAPRVKMGRSA
jgi:hypothetical protein